MTRPTDCRRRPHNEIVLNERAGNFIAAVSVTGKLIPDPEATLRYQKFHRQYQRLYPALKGEFKNISGML